MAAARAPGTRRLELPRRSRPDGATPELRFGDNSTIRMALLQEQIEVQTRYGKLVVPLADIRTIEFAVRVPVDVAKRLDAASTDLASDDQQTRAKAVAEFLALKELAWPVVVGLAKSTNKDLARHAIEVQEKLHGQLSEEQRNMRSFDVIRTDAFTINGTIVGTGLKARSPYFGEVEVQLANLRTYRRMRGSDMDRDLVIDSARSMGCRRALWLDTGIELERKPAFRSRPAGRSTCREVTGSSSPARRAIINSAIAATPFSRAASWDGSGKRAGNFSSAIITKAKITERGKLYLRIVSGPWGNQSIGEYKVKVTGH